jgi:SRSO17 transposase
LAKGLPGRIGAFVEKFTSYFTLLNSSAQEVSIDYLNGLFVSDKRNCQKISKKVDRNHQSLNHFISESPWDWTKISEPLSRLFIKALPTSWLADLSLSIDESGIPKKGKHSVGVAHQYCGQLGKSANSQVGVYAGLVCRGFYGLIDALLYLPKSWCDRRDVDIPLERRTHKTKIQLALELILHARNVLKIPFKWVNFDSFYGRDQNFLYALHQQQIDFVGDIPKDATVYVKKPTLYIPEKKTSKGRNFTRYQVKGKAVAVQAIKKKLSDRDFKSITMRLTKEGEPVKALFYITTVFLAIKEFGTVIEVKLMIRKDADGTIRYALSNNLKASQHRLAFMHCQRYFIERSFQELKQQIGLNEYQVRSYAGWHRHMFMCMMALLFIQIEKLEYLKINCVPSTAQLAEIIKIILPQKIRTIVDVLTEVKDLKIPKDKYCGSGKKSVT